MPSLAEILSARGDADYAQGGYGGADPVLNTAATVGYLQHAADMQAEANRYILKQHDDNLKAALDSYGAIDTKGILGTDQAALMGQYASVGKDLANNFSVIRNPLSNPQQAIKLKQGEGVFRQNLAQSQMDATYVAKQQQFLDQHPEFNTPENKAKIDAFIAAPISQRRPFALQPPLVYNPDAFYKTIGELSKYKYATSKSDGKYITKEEGEKVDPKKFMALAQNVSGVDQYGQSLESARRKAFDNMPDSIKALHNNDYNQFVIDEAKLHMPLDEIKKSDVNEDQFATIKAQGAQQRQTEGMRQGFEAAQKELDRQNALNIARLKADGKDPNDAPTVRQDLIERARIGVKNDKGIGAGEELKAIVAANQQFGGPLEINIDKKNKDIQTFIIPQRTVGGNIIEKHAVRLDASNPETYQAGLNQLLNDITGEHVSLSKAVSAHGKGYVKGGLQNPAINTNAAFKASNGNSYTHADLLKLGYTEDQIQQAVSLGNLKQ
jgi:hypothetical protein